MSMHLLPPAEGTCPVCATKHDDHLPHNAQSLYYQYRFYGLHNRWPTWADAIAHCDDETQDAWARLLREKGAWSESPEGVEPIAEPPEAATRQLVEMKDTTQTIELPKPARKPTARRLSAAPSRGKWPVYQIGRDFYAAPTRRKAIELAKQTAGITRGDLRLTGVVQVGLKTLTQPLIDDEEKPVDATLASLRDAAQMAGEPRHICSEQG